MATLNTLFDSECELLCGGIARSISMDSIPYDVAALIGQFIGYHDEWDPTACDKALCIENNGDKLRCVGYYRYCRDSPGHVVYALGLKTVRIDCKKSQNRRVEWKLKLRGGRTKGNTHVCCGIGIVKREKYETNLRNGNFPIFSTNTFNLEQKTGYESLIGFQCETYKKLKPTIYPGWIKESLQDDRHFVNDTSHNSNAKMNDKSCFMDRDTVRLVLDLKAFNLKIYVNGSLVPKYKRSISGIESGAYSLCVWLYHTKHSIQLIP